MATKNLSKVIHQLKTDQKLLERFFSDPGRVVAECGLTIGETLEFVSLLDELPGCEGMRKIEISVELLEAAAKKPD